MKSYCKGYTINQDRVSDAFVDWARHDSGRKNLWRVESEHGGEERLERQIADEIRHRHLAFAPMKSYQIMDGANGKLRTITVESCKQQVCDYIAVRAMQPMLDARRARACCPAVGARHVMVGASRHTQVLPEH